MSWKGFTKGIARAPQSFRQKFNKGDITVDPVYADAELRFKELEQETKRLHDESSKYYTGINGMLDHQLGFSTSIEEIYKPISGRMSDPNSAKPEGNPEGIKACEAYRDSVNELKAALKPELDMIDTRIVQPTSELLEIIKAVRKILTKRNHKQLDLDRHQRTHAKLETKKDKSLKEEKSLYKAEADVEAAKQEYEYYNEMLKHELPQLFALEAQFIVPLFQSFYYMQLNIFYMMFEHMQTMKIPYFDLDSDIEQGFLAKRGNVQELAEAIPITRFNLGKKTSKLPGFQNKPDGTPLSPSAVPGASNTLPTSGYTPVTVVPNLPNSAATTIPTAVGSSSTAAPPPYSANTYPQAVPTQAYPQPASSTNAYGYANEKATYQPIQQPQPQLQQPGYPAYPTSAATTTSTTTTNTSSLQPTSYTPSPVVTSPPGYGVAAPSPIVAPAPAPAVALEYCIANYAYTAQAAGDLTFPAGAVIQIVQKGDPNGWWTGLYNGQQGVFPGNYVTLKQ